LGKKNTGGDPQEENGGNLPDHDQKQDLLHKRAIYVGFEESTDTKKRSRDYARIVPGE